MNRLVFALLAASAAFAQNNVSYTVHNNCPAEANLYIAGVYYTTLPQGASVTEVLGSDAGFFYTDVNGGLSDGLTTRAGFFGEYGYYYIVKDVDHFNVGMSITPKNQPSHNNLCATDECDLANCTNAYTFPPTDFGPPGNQAASSPLYECPGNNAGWDITFCPSGTFPGQPQEWEIHPGLNNENNCIDVRGDVQENGTPVQIYGCNGTPAQRWNIDRGSTNVRLAGTNYCLDAGSDPASGIGMKIWECYDNLPAQQWYYTDDNRIAVEGKGQCLDLTNGILTNGQQLQTWACTANDANQVWTLSATRSPNPPPPPALHFHPNGDLSKCLDVRGAVFADGTPVQIYDCNGTPAQNWNYVRGTTTVRLDSTNFCLDAGSAPANGVGMKIWQCYDGLAAQQWAYSTDNRLSLLNKGLCLDLTNGNLANGNQVQTWACTPNNPNQVWTT